MRIVSNANPPRMHNLTVGLSIGLRAGLAAILIWIVAWSELAIGLSPAWGQTQALPTETVRVLGKGMRSDQGPAVARDAAIANGLNGAVIQMALTIVPSDLFVTHFEALIALLDQQTDSFIRRYKVLAEQDTEKEYQVLIEAVVMRDKIKDAVDQAGLLVKEKPLSTILFLVSEQRIGETEPRFWWHTESTGETLFAESALARVLGAKGYGIADHSTPMVDGVDRMELNAVEAVRMGRHYHADVVITGKALARMAKNTRVTDLKTYEGVLTVRAYQVNSGAQIALSHAQSVSVNTDDIAGGKSVMQLVANDVAEDVARQLSAHRRHPDESILSPITVDVSGTDQLRAFVALRKALNTLPGVERMQIEALSPPRATLVVHFRGSANDMAERLKNTKPETLNIQVDPMSEDHVQVILLP